MASYYVNKNAQTNGDHEVHVSGCTYLPAPANRAYLGEFTSCVPAVAEAKRQRLWPRVNGCFYCCRPCHTS